MATVFKQTTQVVGLACMKCRTSVYLTCAFGAESVIFAFDKAQKIAYIVEV